jgi:xylulokinase
MAAILSAELALRWLRDQVFGLSGNDAYERMTAWAASTPAGARGLLFLPYLSGERTPHMDPQARGLLLGLTAGHGQAELVRAVMEGVILACYDAYSVLAELGAKPEQIVLAGGGAKSRLWQQIAADVFDLPVRPSAIREQSALGAILLAGEGAGLFAAGQTAGSWAMYGPQIEPDAGRHKLYRDLLGLFRDAYIQHRDDFSLLESVEGDA